MNVDLVTVDELTEKVQEIDLSENGSLDELIQSKLEDMEWGDIVRDALQYSDYVDRDSVHEIAREVVDEHGVSGESAVTDFLESYLDGFEPGQGCRVVRIFETAVRTIVRDEMAKAGGGEIGATLEDTVQGLVERAVVRDLATLEEMVKKVVGEQVAGLRLVFTVTPSPEPQVPSFVSNGVS